MRIALVNDLQVALAALHRIVESMPGAQVAWAALDGLQAVERCASDTPDLILMDMIMPVMDGVEATRRIMQDTPCPIVVVTATVDGNADRVYEALGHGALDAVNTPVLGTGGSLSGGDALIRKIRAVQRLSTPRSALPVTHAPVDLDKRGTGTPLIAIGSSTGGPQALVEVLRGLPATLPAGVVIVQHIDVQFAPGLASWLASETRRTVRVIESGQSLAGAGIVDLACTGDHLILDAGGRYRYVQEPADHPYRPSVDVFFESLLAATMFTGVAVLLTGMGQDGAGGMLALRRAGWHTIAQDKKTSVVWGMPGAAVGMDAAIEVLPPAAIGPASARHIGRRRGC